MELNEDLWAHASTWFRACDSAVGRRSSRLLRRVLTREDLWRLHGERELPRHMLFLPNSIPAMERYIRAAMLNADERSLSLPSEPTAPLTFVVTIENAGRTVLVARNLPFAPTRTSGLDGLTMAHFSLVNPTPGGRTYNDEFPIISPQLLESFSATHGAILRADYALRGRIYVERFGRTAWLATFGEFGEVDNISSGIETEVNVVLQSHSNSVHDLDRKLDREWFFYMKLFCAFPRPLEEHTEGRILALSFDKFDHLNDDIAAATAQFRAALDDRVKWR